MPKAVCGNGKAVSAFGEKDLKWVKEIHSRIHAKQHVIQRMKGEESISLFSYVTYTYPGFLFSGLGNNSFF